MNVGEAQYQWLNTMEGNPRILSTPLRNGFGTHSPHLSTHLSCRLKFGHLPFHVCYSSANVLMKRLHIHDGVVWVFPKTMFSQFSPHVSIENMEFTCVDNRVEMSGTPRTRIQMDDMATQTGILGSWSRCLAYAPISETLIGCPPFITHAPWDEEP